MKSVLLYTFRTNKHAKEFKDIFIFGKLKQDFETFSKLIEKKKPKLIIGLAEIKTNTRIESIAINKFGTKGTISKTGKKSYGLYIPQNNPFPISKKPTTSFCNWTMYKISELGVSLVFIHYHKSDLVKVLSFLKML